MEITYDNIAAWFDEYYQAFNKYTGPPESPARMERYFAPELEFWPYNMAGTTRPSSREDLLRTMIRPGLHEELTPLEYVIDLTRMVVAVRFRLQFTDENSGRVWPAISVLIVHDSLSIAGPVVSGQWVTGSRAGQAARHR